MSLICNPTRAFVSLIVHFERSSTRSARAIASRDALAKTLKRRDRHRHRRRCVAARASRGVGMERTHLNVIERPLSEQFHFLSRRHRDRARRVKTERRVGRRATCRARRRPCSKQSRRPTRRRRLERARLGAAHDDAKVDGDGRRAMAGKAKPKKVRSSCRSFVASRRRATPHDAAR